MFLLRYLGILLCAAFYTAKAGILYILIMVVLAPIITYWKPEYEKYLLDHKLVGAVLIGFIAVNLLLTNFRWVSTFVVWCSGSKKMQDGEDKERITSILNDLFLAGKVKGIKGFEDLKVEDISLFIEETDDLNAFACGTHILGVTRAALSLPDFILSGVIAHELGHLINDRGFALQIVACQSVVRLLSLPMGFALFILELISFIPFLGFLVLIYSLVWRVICFVLMFFDYIVYFIHMMFNRHREYKADEFAAALGYGEDLVIAFDIMKGDNKENPWDDWFSTHPCFYKRINNIQKTIPGTEEASDTF